MTIVKGKPYSFVVTVMQKGTTIPQNLQYLDVTSTFDLVELSTLAVTNGLATFTVLDAVNGKLSITISNTTTSTLVYERGDKADNYYPKVTYQGVLTINFTDSTPDITAIIPAIRIAPGV